MTFWKKLSRDKINSKFVDIQNRIIGAPDNHARKQVISEYWYPLKDIINQSDHFGKIDPLDLTERMEDYLDRLGSTAPQNILSLYYFEKQLQPPSGPSIPDNRRPLE